MRQQKEVRPLRQAVSMKNLKLQNLSRTLCLLSVLLLAASLLAIASIVPDEFKVDFTALRRAEPFSNYAAPR